MAYSSGFLKDIIYFYHPEEVTNEYGESVDTYDKVMYQFPANISFVKGIKALREGTLDSYETILVRMRYNEFIDRDCVLSHDARDWRITSYHSDYQANEIQITAIEIKGNF